MSDAVTTRPTVVISCKVLENLLGKRLPAGVPAVWLDIMLHNSPKKLGAALQEELDRLPEPRGLDVRGLPPPPTRTAVG